MKKPLKIVMLKEVIKKMKTLPDKDRKMIEEAMKKIAKDPTNCKNTMSLFGEPSAEELHNWASDVKPLDVDLVLEYLHDKDCLTEKGLAIAKEHWTKYIRGKK